MSAAALPVLLFGLLTLLGTGGYLIACRDLPENDVPQCCRRRVRTFAAHAVGTAVVAALVAGVGAALLVLG